MMVRGDVRSPDNKSMMWFWSDLLADSDSERASNLSDLATCTGVMIGSARPRRRHGVRNARER
jgi:hypothetical protein